MLDRRRLGDSTGLARPRWAVLLQGCANPAPFQGEADFVSKTTNIDSRLMSTRANAVVGSFARVLEDHDLDEEEKW